MIRFGNGCGDEGDGAEGRACCQALKAFRILDTMVKQNNLFQVHFAGLPVMIPSHRLRNHQRDLELW
ncbi:hypothetical protein RS9917_05990 [Synechococcus sp. RS9917]|nr:hypothetical protein RS9917_05990 [Synechococcus sp. RS9917]